MKRKVLKVQNISHRCVVCGIKNPASLRTRFLEVGDGILVGIPDARDIHQSYPGRMHGGIISALLDETVGRAVQIDDETEWGVTGELSVRYLKPVPLDSPIYVAAKLDANNRRLFSGTGKLISADTGEVLATCSAKYVKLSPERITGGGDFLHTEWEPDTRPAPREIELPDGLF